jgi:hypothetical protein
MLEFIDRKELLRGRENIHGQFIRLWESAGRK